jgi:neutral ceramidase
MKGVSRKAKMNVNTILGVLFSAMILQAAVVSQSGVVFANHHNLEHGLHVGYTKIDITPPLGIELGGFRGPRPAEEILTRLYAYAVYIKNGTDSVLLINADAIHYSQRFVDQIKNRITDVTGLSRNQIMILETHSHSAPVVTPEYPGYDAVNFAYREQLIDQLVDVGIAAVQGELHKVTELKSFSREFEGIGTNRAFENGPVDNTLRGVVFERESDVPLILVNYGCHPRVVGINRKLSADYPGEVVSYLESQGFDAVFLSGALGDIDPIQYSDDHKVLALIGRKVGEAVLNAINTTGVVKEDYSIRTASITFRVPVHVGAADEDLATIPRKLDTLARWFDGPGSENPDDKTRYNAEVMRDYYEECLEISSFGKKIYLQALIIGDVVLLGLPGEVFTGVATTIRQAFPEKTVLVLGQANGTVGYFPTRDDYDNPGNLGLSGYAARSAPRIYNSLPFEPGVGEAVAGTAIDLLRYEYSPSIK